MSVTHELSGYRILGQLGRGGTAEVARVFSPKLHREAALKYASERSEGENVDFPRLCAREFKLIGNLRFPGLVHILDFSPGKQTCLLMELCHGPTLDQVGQVADLNVALNLISAAALDLEYLRARSIVHGDLKAQNIFLPQSWRQRGDNKLFYVKLSDFSLGRTADEPQEERAGLGTVGYMAPETITDRQCTSRSDLFALGVISYRLLTGRHPYIDGDDADPVHVNARVLETQPEPIESLRPDAPALLVQLVGSLLAANESDRPKTAWEVCRILREAGARYPFEKALRPAHLLTPGKSYRESVESILDLTDRQRERLERICAENGNSLRLALTVNFLKGLLVYKTGRFAFKGDVYWPSRLRRETLRRYQAATFGERRLLTRVAIAGGVTISCKLGLIGEGRFCDVSPLFFETLRQFIHAHVIRKLSSGLAAEAERRELHTPATDLYLQSGNLEGAERCAYQAAVALNKEHLKSDALTILARVIGYARMIGRDHAVRQLLMTKGDIHKEVGNTASAMAAYQAIVDQYEQASPDAILAETYKNLGDLYKMKQNFQAGIESLQSALAIYRKLDDEREVSHTLNNMGNMYFVAADYAAALHEYRTALQIQRRLSARSDVATTLSNIGSVYAIQGRLGRSLHLYSLALQITRDIGNQSEIARLLNNLGYIHHLCGQPGKSVDCLMESLEINRRIGSKKEVLFNLDNLTVIMISAGQLRKSLQHLKEGMALAEALADKPHLGAFKTALGTVLKRMGRFGDADTCYQEATQIYADLDDATGNARLSIGRADLAYHIGDGSKALTIATEALDAACAVGEKPNELDALLVVTRVSDNEKLIGRAFDLADELHLSQERTVFAFNSLASKLRQGNATAHDEHAHRALADLDEMPDNIEVPGLCNTAAELMVASDRNDRALRYLQRAERVAAASGLNPELVTTFTLRGMIETAEGEYERGYADYRKALEISRKIADGIHDEKDLLTYQGRPAIRFLQGEIKRLVTAVGTVE